MLCSSQYLEIIPKKQSIDGWSTKTLYMSLFPRKLFWSKIGRIYLMTAVCWTNLIPYGPKHNFVVAGKNTFCPQFETFSKPLEKWRLTIQDNFWRFWFLAAPEMVVTEVKPVLPMSGSTRTESPTKPALFTRYHGASFTAMTSYLIYYFTIFYKSIGNIFESDFYLQARGHDNGLPCNQVSFSPTFFEKLLHMLVPKGKKKHWLLDWLSLLRIWDLRA